MSIMLISPECLVEPSVEEGVVAVGGHRCDVTEEEGEVVELPAENVGHACVKMFHS